jgi:hypothetical protein
MSWLYRCEVAASVGTFRLFDIPLLARRLELVTRWAIAEPDTRGLPIGYFGASTGAARGGSRRSGRARGGLARRSS